jgi:alpha-N-arabinofuranosidase
MKILPLLAGLILTASAALPAEYHVAVGGNDGHPGTRKAPLRTIQRAAELAQPGDVITVHAGVYRERVSPPRGGTSDRKRIIYRAAPGEKVTITGSEPVLGWERVSGDTWKAAVPNSSFGPFNPYLDLIHGDWFSANGRDHHTGCVYLNGDWLAEARGLDEVMKPAGPTPLWFAKVDRPEVAGGVTVFYAQFPGSDPNRASVEINVRQTVFTPNRPGINYITVRGFDLRNAATPWAPPTAGQIGVVSAYWCKGWVIEDNEISYSACSGVALGKYGDEWDNRAESAEGYVGTLTRALANGWNRETVGSHLIRNNHIHHCGQTGVVGSLGCSFSTVSGNDIHDIHLRNAFGGAEMAGIKFHGAIDVAIRGNHIYRCGDVAGLWLDWMAQGAKVTGNLFHDNTGGCGDIFLEMQHGPILVANNILLSPGKSLALNSQGIAFVHNLIVGPIDNYLADTRATPYQKAHATELAGMHAASPLNDSGDHRFYNNIILPPCRLDAMDKSALACLADGNVFLKGARPSKFDAAPLLRPDFDAGLRLEQASDGWYLTLDEDAAWSAAAKCRPVTTESLGRAAVSGCAYENFDGSPLRIGADYAGRARNATRPSPGPFEIATGGKQRIKVWPPASF